MARPGSAALLALILICPDVLAAQATARELPFGPGEELVFRARNGKFGRFGRATMRVEGPVDVRGTSSYLLSFDFKGKVLLFGIEDETRSWFDPARMASLRYSKRERSPIASRDEAVELYPAERRWIGQNGVQGEAPNDSALDELSILYFLRTLALEEGGVYAQDRHYDIARNPITVRVIGRETITVEAGEYRTVIVDMHVTDPGRYGGGGVVRLYLTDDVDRVPVRIESSMPVAGKVTLDLEARLIHGGSQVAHRR